MIVFSDTDPASATAVAPLWVLSASAPAPPAARLKISPALSAVTEKRRAAVSTTKFSSATPESVTSASRTKASVVAWMTLSLNAPARATALLLCVELPLLPPGSLLALVKARPPVAAMMRFWLLARTSRASAVTMASDNEAWVTSLTRLIDAAAAMATPVPACCCLLVCFCWSLSGVVLVAAPATVKV